MPIHNALLEPAQRPDLPATSVKSRVRSRLAADEQIVASTRVAPRSQPDSDSLSCEGLPEKAWMVCTDRRLFFVEDRSQVEMPVVPFEQVKRFEVTSGYGPVVSLDLVLQDGRRSSWDFESTEGTDLADFARQYRVGRNR